MQFKMKDGEVNNFSTSITIDLDSGLIGIYNRYTDCIFHTIEDFVGEFVESMRHTKGFVETRSPLLNKGTLKWKCEDDTVTEHKFLITNYYYVPSGKHILLITQHDYIISPSHVRCIHRSSSVLYQ